MKIFSLVSLIFLLCGFAPPSIDTNNDGVKNYKEENYNEAFKNFAQALSRDPQNPIMHFNLADAFHKSGESKKAQTEFEAIESMPTAHDDIKFQAMFNAGNIAVEQKEIDKALEYYQKALKYKPDSVETKTNIELALKDSQGGGGGKNDKEQKQDDKKDQKQQEQNKQDQNQDQKKDQKPAPRPQPKPFQSKDLNENDVRRILEELKRQEQEIRAKQQKSKRAQEPPSGKDW